jgi:hypothetical protein
MTGTISQRRRVWTATACAGFLAAFVLGYGNQGLESWRLDRLADGTPWWGELLGSIDQTAWRLTAPDEAQARSIWLAPVAVDPRREWAGALTRDVAIIVLGWLLVYAACRGVSAVRGRVSLYFSVVSATVIAVLVPYVAVIPLQFGTALGGQATAFYYGEISAGLLTGLSLGLLAALVAVLIYRADQRELASPFAPPFDELDLFARHDPDDDTLIEGFDAER